jgi:hypothetical protein
MNRPRFVQTFCAAAVLVLHAGQALAWGATGHRIIGRLAIEALPAQLPAFLRTSKTAEAIGELSREPDRWKGAGRTHDSDRDPGHYVNIADDGKIAGGPAASDLPETREAYDGALRAVGSDSWKVGYLPYSIIDAWQQLAQDFASWRIDRAGADHTADPAHRAWLEADLAERQQLILRDIGTLSHYVGDGSQPLHVTVHYNGWGPFPNPDGYTEEHVHGPFEGAFVHDHVDPSAVRAAMKPYRDCQCGIAKWTQAYLSTTEATVIPLYQLYKAGGFADGDLRGRVFATQRLAAGADALRDVIVDAWRASATDRAGWPAVGVAEVEAGKVDPYESLFGVD